MLGMTHALVTPASTARERSAAGSCFLADIGVIAHRGFEEDRLRRHLRPREITAIPGLDFLERAAARAEGEQQNRHRLSFHLVFSCSSFSISARVSGNSDLWNP